MPLLPLVHRKQETSIVSAGARGKFAGLYEFVDRFSKVNIAEFGIHSVYIIGTPTIEVVTQSVAITISTENLLLNVYRQAQTGLPSILQVDTTHRLVIEGHNCMLFGLVDPAQHFHVIGYGLCSEEDTSAHINIARALKEEVERVVNQRICDQQLI